MTLGDIIDKYQTLREMPPLCIFGVLEKNNENILWIDPDAYRKNSFFIIIDKNKEIIKELTFKEFNESIDHYLENGWRKEKDSIILKDVKTWINDFAKSYGIPI